MLPSPKELKVFSEVYLSNNLSRSAERLDLSQPAISKIIKRLETNLSTELFIRQKNGVKPTQAAISLFKHVNEFIAYWQQVKSSCHDVANEVAGTINLGVHQSLAKTTLPFFLPSLINAYPKLSINLAHDLSRNIVEQVILLKIDIAIVANPIAHPDLVIIKLFDDTVTFISHINNTNHNILICDQNLTQTKVLIQQAKKQGHSFQQTIETNHLELISTLINQKVGIGILPVSIAKLTGEKALKPLDSFPCYHDEISLCFHRDNRKIKAIQSIKRHIIEKLQKK